MKDSRRRSGFTLIELLVVVLIIGVLASTAIPQYFKLVEKSKIAEALQLLNAVRAAEDRYMSKYNAYCTGAITGCAGFDLNVPTMKYFTPLTTINTGSSSPGWKASITRNSNTAVYGTYIVTLDAEPNAGPKLTCSQTNCSAELLPQ